MDLEPKYRHEQGSGESTDTGYRVEARYMASRPEEIAGQIFDREWRRVSFDKSPIGVPSCSPFRKSLRDHGYLSYPAAQALRWWLHAVADTGPTMGLCLETRLVSFKIETTHRITAIEAHAATAIVPGAKSERGE